ncbi:MAG: MoaD/ThiS family protein [Granulosicoccus sp.]
MRIEITLGGALIEYLPQNKSGNRFTFSNDSSLSVADLLSTMGVKTDQRLLTILNGQIIQPEAYKTTLLNDGDGLSLMPPIVAG